MALYRHRPELVSALKKVVSDYVESVSSETGTIAPNSTIVDAGYIKNVRIGEYCKIEGTARLKNGSINSNRFAPVHVGVGVIGDDFIISSGSSVEDRATISGIRIQPRIPCFSATVTERTERPVRFSPVLSPSRTTSPPCLSPECSRS